MSDEDSKRPSIIELSKRAKRAFRAGAKLAHLSATVIRYNVAHKLPRRRVTWKRGVAEGSYTVFAHGVGSVTVEASHENPGMVDVKIEGDKSLPAMPVSDGKDFLLAISMARIQVSAITSNSAPMLVCDGDGMDITAPQQLFEIMGAKQLAMAIAVLTRMGSDMWGEADFAAILGNVRVITAKPGFDASKAFVSDQGSKHRREVN